jgi:hypothetical protein
MRKLPAGHALHGVEDGRRRDVGGNRLRGQLKTGGEKNDSGGKSGLTLE